MRFQSILAFLIFSAVAVAGFLSLRSANQATTLESDSIVGGENAGAIVTPDRVCPEPNMSYEECLWMCDDIATQCVKTTTISGVDCYECRDRRPQSCQPPTSPESQCLRSCGGECLFAYLTQSRERCMTCETAETCKAPTFPTSDCASRCNAGETCQFAYTAEDGVACSQCESNAVAPECPTGQFADQSACEGACPNGVCIDGGTNCYSCYSCPAPLFNHRLQCADACDEDCTPNVQSNQYTCWQCPQSCDDICAQGGYEFSRNYHDEIKEEISDISCVTGVRLQLSRASIRGCDCSKKPVVEIDRTPPVCTGTPCGNIACGQTVNCTGDGGEQLSLKCAWRGWKDVGQYQFQAQIRVE